MNTPSTSPLPPRVERALALALEDREAACRAPEAHVGRGQATACPDGPRLRVAIGDPQAPLATIFGILERHGLLGETGRLAPGVVLHSVGDHLDWGGAKERPRNLIEGTALLAWLAAHPPGAVVLVAGNHDLARVGELWGVNDSMMESAVEAALAVAVEGPQRQAEGETGFGARFPAFPSSLEARRDLAAYGTEQRELVAALLEAGRLTLAAVIAPDRLLTHAGITREVVAALGLGGEHRAAPIAARLQEHLEAAWRARVEDQPLEVPGLYRPGALGRPARGIMCWNPANPEIKAWEPGPPDRVDWFDPRAIPPDLDQVVGHVRDFRCRERLGAWCRAEPSKEGPVRSLVSGPDRTRYARGIQDRRPGEGRMLFLDGRIGSTPDADVELLDLDRMEPVA